MNERIFILEDDAFLRDGLSEMLQKEGYATETASTCKGAREAISNSRYNLIIFDVMLPDGSGLDLCAEFRKTDNNTPILFLTACDDEIQIVRGLDAGADDYVTKPFKLLELLSRVRALLRRNSNSVVKSKDVSINSQNLTVMKNGENIFVTPTEFQILSILIRNNGIIVTRNTLLQNIWDDNNNFIDDNTLSVHISRLREKIGAEYIATIRGVGYRWEEH
ncbi:MAG: response regulator transcription factor [Eubacterium sp.]|nr:response regulator transcription factor [Eubacterium sp.]MDE6412328.1 response regulator transcription factor [Eubacterium sp.]